MTSKLTQNSQDDPPWKHEGNAGSLVDVRETQAARRANVRHLRCNYTDDGSTRMHRGYGNLLK